MRTLKLDGDDCDSDGYGPAEGYYPDGGYGYAGDLADADAWEHALSCTFVPFCA